MICEVVNKIIKESIFLERYGLNDLAMSRFGMNVSDPIYRSF
jgi:hypothetical protein